MKVAFLTGSTHDIPRLGREARIFHIAEYLGSSGITVGLFGSRFTEETLGVGVTQFPSLSGWSGGDWYPLSLRNSPTLVKNLPSLVHQSRRISDYDVVLCELGAAWQALWFKAINQATIVLDEHNVEWILMRQQSTSAGEPYAWNRLRTYERICHSSFDHISVVSPVDKKLFESEGTPGSKMTVVPNGVDTGTFRPDSEGGESVRKQYGIGAKDNLIMYMGSLKFFPNVDAVDSILKRIYPAARVRVPNIRLMITGPGSENLVGSIPPEVVSTGVVDRSLLPAHINAADICIAPLRFGSGTRFKILEWMACGRPVIATRKAAEGIDVRDGEDIILEDAIERYPQRISELCGDPGFRQKLGDNGRNLVESRYSWEVCVSPMEKWLKGRRGK
jgi:glycosyltransferase involved in cell wall biosynthesis